MSDANEVDMAAFLVGSVPDDLLVVGEVNDPAPNGPTRECVLLVTAKTGRQETWGWALAHLRSITDVRGVPLVLACRMFVEQERKDEVRLAT